eukprot:m.451782 g.451782  ORF g.451782 m.451782 type:complete len:233 (+) comp20207_c0_seq1:32-730(+)
MCEELNYSSLEVCAILPPVLSLNDRDYGNNSPMTRIGQVDFLLLLSDESSCTVCEITFESPISIATRMTGWRNLIGVALALLLCATHPAVGTPIRSNNRASQTLRVAPQVECDLKLTAPSRAVIGERCTTGVNNCSFECFQSVALIVNEGKVERFATSKVEGCECPETAEVDEKYPERVKGHFTTKGEEHNFVVYFAKADAAPAGTVAWASLDGSGNCGGPWIVESMQGCHA